MKRAILMLLLAALLLCGCQTEETLFTVDTEAKTITDNFNTTYSYTDRTIGDMRTITIYYPDSTSFTWTQTPNSTQSSYSGDAIIAGFAPGEDLLAALGVSDYELGDVPQVEQVSAETPMNLPLILIGLLLAGLGLWNVCSPRSAWYAQVGWRYNNLEPSENGLLARGVMGAFGIICGLVLVAMGVFSNYYY